MPPEFLLKYLKQKTEQVAEYGRTRWTVFSWTMGFRSCKTAYPEVKKILDYPSLKLHPFYSGALVFWRGKFHKMADPWRHPMDSLKRIFSPPGTLFDKWRLGKFRYKLNQEILADLFRRPESFTIKVLKETGFSDSMIQGFFRPLLAGVFFRSYFRNFQTDVFFG